MDRLKDTPSETLSGFVDEPDAGQSSVRKVQTFEGEPEADTEALPPSTEQHDRYVLQELLGRGGSGEVRRALDRTLNRLVAIKTIREDRQVTEGMTNRFKKEAQIVAQLEHPGIVPVHDLGRLPDGQLYITMKEIQGQNLAGLIHAVHLARIEAGGLWKPTANGWTQRRLVGVLRTVCSAVGFAHDKGVIHRDLKPENVMTGQHGEVFVVDWGLAKLVGANAPGVVELSDADHGGVAFSTQTVQGAVVGTPSYMAPEQARGDRSFAAATDVWSLGGILFAILYGRPPYEGPIAEVLEAVRKGPPEPPKGFMVPEPLVEIWRKCMRMRATERYHNGTEVGQEIEAWELGSLAREKAMRLVDEAQALIPGLRQKQGTAARARERARAQIVALRPTDALREKEEAWKMEEEAQAELEAVEASYRDIATKARFALAQVPDLPEAHRILATLYRERAETAERDGDAKSLQEYRALLEEHDDGTHTDFLKNEGVLQLNTHPQGATIFIRQYIQRTRRLIAKKYGKTGPTPLRALRLPAGSYLIELQRDGCRSTTYPVLIERGSVADMVPPGAKEPQSIWLAPEGQLHKNERLVPAGHFISGGDPDALAGLPRQRLWVDTFSIGAQPITHREYLQFLNDLVTQGHLDLARQHAPRSSSKTHPEERLLYDFDSGATSNPWSLPEEVQELMLESEAPVVGVTWHDANAYCQWHAARTSQPWRLPGEYEWEKAGRGVDGRVFPWGNTPDPVFHCMQDSPLVYEGPPPAERYPIDESPYGVLALSGTVQEWCADVFRPQGPNRKGARAVTPEVGGEREVGSKSATVRYSLRGGAWNLPERACRLASRQGLAPGKRAPNLGFRICRSLPEGDRGDD